MDQQPVFECRLQDLEVRDARGFDWQDGDRPRQGFVVRTEASVFAYLNVCPHAGNPLNWKPHAFLTRDRGLIMCSVHGAIFEIESGTCVGGPCPGRILQRLRVETSRGSVVVYPD